MPFNFVSLHLYKNCRAFLKVTFEATDQGSNACLLRGGKKKKEEK